MLRLEATTALGGFELDAAVEVAPHECLAIVGPSGAGKTTLLRIAAGLVRPDAGLVRCAGQVWLDTSAGVDLPPERRRVGYLFQEYALFSHLRAWQNVAYGIREAPRAERQRRARDLLERFGLAERADARPRTLSGGEQQRVALARALATEPSTLLLDEPLSALDIRARTAAARELLATLRESAVPTLLVTHDFAEAALLGTRIAVLDRGWVVQLGTAAELSAAPASAFVAELVGAVILPGPDGLVALYPWELELAPVSSTTAANSVRASIEWTTQTGERSLVGLITHDRTPRAFVAETTPSALAELGLDTRATVAVTWDPATARPLPAAPVQPTLTSAP